MKIVSLSWVRNEEDIIESFVRHHASMLDTMVIIDNASTDSTFSILEQLLQEGLPIEIIRDESVMHRQGETLTKIMHEAIDSHAWVLPLDADEFLCGDIAADVPPDVVTLLPWKTYVPHSSDDLHEQCCTCRIRHRKTVEQPQFHKILIPPALRTGAQIPMGSHFLLNRDGAEMPSRVAEHLHLAHFPVRSSAQIYRKVHEGWQRHSANPAKKPGQNFHWQRWTEELPAPTDIDAELLTHIALHYALPKGQQTDTRLTHDPVHCRCKLACTPHVQLSPEPLGVQ